MSATVAPERILQELADALDVRQGKQGDRRACCAPAP